MYTQALALVLAAAPSENQPRASFDVADAEVVTGDNSTHLLAYDSEGEVSAEIVAWLDSSDQQRLDIVFADGLYLSVADGVVETDDATEVAARVVALQTTLASWEEVDSDTLLACGLSAASTAAACAFAHLAICAVTAGWTGYHCGNLLEEWAG